MYTMFSNVHEHQGFHDLEQNCHFFFTTLGTLLQFSSAGHGLFRDVKHIVWVFL